MKWTSILPSHRRKAQAAPLQQQSPQPESQITSRTPRNSKFHLPKLKCTPKIFPRFNDLPEELQIQIIKHASLNETPLILGISLPISRSNNSLDWRRWNTNPLLYVSRKFRTETLRLRPLSFGIMDNNTILSTPTIDFDFSRDLLVLEEEELQSVYHYKIQDMEKVERLVLTWGSDYNIFENVSLLKIIRRRMTSLKLLVLVHKGLFYPKFERAVRKDGYHFTHQGPFWSSEDEMRKHFKWHVEAYRRRSPGWEGPIVVSWRIEKLRWFKPPSRRLERVMRDVKDRRAVARWNLSTSAA